MHSTNGFVSIMAEKYSEQQYELMLEALFRRFPSFQQVGSAAYNPGLERMVAFDALAGHPHEKYKIIHVAGTNGKGSVSNMLTSVLSASGLHVGLFTSPHILDFRERARILEGDRLTYISKDFIWEFYHQWKDVFDHLDLSLFEISTMMAFKWFESENVDIAVVETGLGGRLDSTNIVTPILSVITNIGLDHCNILGETIPEIAFEKAGIIKPLVPVVVGESHPETDPVFERKVLYTNMPEPSFMGDRRAIMSLLTFADKTEPSLWPEHEDILAGMDLQGSYQRKNLRTVLAALDVLSENHDRCVREAIINTARRTDFHGRWEKLSDNPLTICDIGHNEHGLRHNFAQLETMKAEGKCTDLIIVYGSVADKDVDSVLHLMPEEATYIFTRARSQRALPAEKIYEKFAASGRDMSDVHVVENVPDAVRKSQQIAEDMSQAGAEPLIYIGGSTYVVSEAVACRVVTK